ncbi:MAG: DUF4115 domain-containing protein [Gammaproteobacteria bacterium]|jgi:cytoskeleton protein RodZ|nr:DUF4115 domain-containing protein [Gammaproteobacteria bacterium]MBT6042682.1 DUF4115 domain-containing protein [Gammaproteobacteria bacterium]
MSEENQNMEPETDNQSEDSSIDWPAPGQKLKAIRQELGLSHARVAESLHITAHYVKALEDAQYDKLPGKTFVKGYFKAYAKFLGTNVDDIMSCYDQHVTALEESVESEANVQRAKKAYDQNIRWMICAAVIIVLVVGVSWWFSRSEDTAANISENDNKLVAGLTGMPGDVMRNNNVPVAQVNKQVTAEALIASMAQANTKADNISEKVSGDASLGASTATSITELVESTLAVSLGEVSQEEVENNTGINQQSNVEGLLSEVSSTENNGSELVLAQTTNELELNLALTTASKTDNGEEMLQLNENQITSVEMGAPEYTVTRLENKRKIELEIEGNDLLEVHFLGDSWIQIDNAEQTRLYHDMLNMGDDLTIKGTAPFNILIGDASVVEMTFNASEVDVLSRIRSDNSARLILQRENR